MWSLDEVILVNSNPIWAFKTDISIYFIPIYDIVKDAIAQSNNSMTTENSETIEAHTKPSIIATYYQTAIFNFVQLSVTLIRILL